MEKTMGVVAEAALSALIGALIDRLAPLVSLVSTKVLNFVRPEGLEAELDNREGLEAELDNREGLEAEPDNREGLEAELDEWSKMLSKIEAVLEDAEEQQHHGRDRKAVKKWLDDLRDLAYDVDDILDELSTNASQQKLMTGGNQASPSQGGKRKRNFVPDLSASASKDNMEQSSEREENMGLSSEMKEITDRFNDIIKRKGDLKLSETVGRPRQRPASTSVVTEAHVYGREEDKVAVLEFLVGKGRSDAQLSVLPIIGMGGMGKTTLAQLVYNDKEVQKFFDLKAWVCVSEDFDAVRVTKTILQSFREFTSKDCEGKDLNWLQEKLKANLKGKKFLVVLDDLWNEEYNDWTILRAPFEAGAPGSMILITTRNQGVSSATGTIPAYYLKELSNDFCSSILAHHALGKRDFSAHLNLKDIGEELVRRCKGSPLAAKVLGGVLRNKVDRDEWEKVLKSKIWNLPQVESQIAPALMLSYHHLPSNLKRCFAYCSILPKDYEFEEGKLVLLWMAEGLIQPQEEEEQMEDLGREYFRNLYSRSFFQKSLEDESLFVMHDLINDLAQRVAGDICFRMEDRVGGNNRKKPSEKARHSSYLGGEFDGIKKFEVFSHLTRLRTFLPLMLPNPGGCYLTRNVPFELLPKLRRLRVLSLNGYMKCELPESIGRDLKHLRFLDLSHTEISSLPESVGNLYNLQTLILENCFYLEKLPSTFGNLVNLRHLNIQGIDELEGMPQIGKLTCLQTLPHLIVGKGRCYYGLKVLGPLLHLRETLCISSLQNVINREDAWEARLSEKQDLYGLSLNWSGSLDESRDRTSELEVLSMLKPHESLIELTVNKYGGTEFPIWLRVPSFSNMVLLKIENCAKCTSLPAVGKLPSLKVLLIEGMASVQNIGREFCGEGCSQPFRSLETLHFENMEEWKNWIPCEEFPKLRTLSITGCPKLIGKLPNHLPLLENIVIDECRQLVVSISSFPELCKLKIGESKGLVRGNKFDFNSLRFSRPSTILEFPCQIEEEFTMGGLANVEDLTIRQCGELTVSWLLQHLPCLGDLEIDNCSKLVSLVAAEVEEQLQLSLPSKLRKIRIEHCVVLKSLPKAMMHNNTCLEEIYIGHCPSLTHLAIGELPPTLKRLIIRSCQNMQILVDGDDISSCGSLGELPATLRHLEIFGCKKLESIAKSFGDNSSLEAIEISCCENLKSLPMGIHNLSHLDRIFIRGCPILDSFSDEVLLPTNLKALEILWCGKRLALPNWIPNLTSLQELETRPGPRILSFPEGGFPINLTSLSIKIEASFNEAIFEWGLYKLTSLKNLVIYGFSSHLVSFPEMKLPASLTSLTIQHFPNLECMSSKSFQFLASLEELSIGACEKLTIFPEDAVPPSLTSLWISGCGKLKSFPKFGLSPSLKSLKISYCEKLTSFPEDGLPPSLTSLHISNCRKLKSFPKFGLSPSLKSLEISNCKMLTSFPEDGLLPSLTSLDISNCGELKSFPKFGLSPSLEDLKISNCKKLTSFPKDGLPHSLLQLEINKCPQLIDRCEGQEWFKTDHIPYVSIGEFEVYRLEEESE